MGGTGWTFLLLDATRGVAPTLVNN